MIIWNEEIFLAMREMESFAQWEIDFLSPDAVIFNEYRMWKRWTMSTGRVRAKAIEPIVMVVAKGASDWFIGWQTKAQSIELRDIKKSMTKVVYRDRKATKTARKASFCRTWRWFLHLRV